MLAFKGYPKVSAGRTVSPLEAQRPAFLRLLGPAVVVVVDDHVGQRQVREPHPVGAAAGDFRVVADEDLAVTLGIDVGVVAGFAEDVLPAIATLPCVQNVVAGAAIDPIVALVTLQCVVAAGAGKGIIAGRTAQDVAAGSAGLRVRKVGALPRHHDLAVGQQVRRGHAGQRHLAVAIADHGIGPDNRDADGGHVLHLQHEDIFDHREIGDRVGAVALGEAERVAPGTAGQRIVAAAAEELVVAPLAVERVVALAAQQHVIAHRRHG